jgi:uncharacterized Fe-S center protein
VSQKPKVYFSRIPRDAKEQEAARGIEKLLNLSNLLKILEKDALVMVKMHFGEKGNVGHIQPKFVRHIVDSIKEKKAKPFLSDTNTLYIGERHNAVDHLHIACEHGFSIEKIGCPVIIADGLKGMSGLDVAIETDRERPNGSRTKVAIASDAVYADAIIGLAHVTAHLGTGFAACLKNLGMGLSPRRGKLSQHSSQKLTVSDKCDACGACAKWCPEEAISIHQERALIDFSRCIGCGYCLCVCPRRAIRFDWSTKPEVLQERIVEHALAVVQEKRDKCAFLNFAQRVTENCDCISSPGKLLIEDVGILASFDPVALDCASADVVNREAGRDVFKESYPRIDYRHQFRYAQELGLGSTLYELVEV